MADKRKITVIAVSCVILLLVGVRAYLPLALKDYLNQVIDDIPGHAGGIEDVDLNLWRGAYKVHALVIDKVEGGISEPFMDIPLLDISLNWKALLKGQLEGEILLMEPVFNFVLSASEKKETSGEEGNWQETLASLLPIKIDRLEVENGEFHFMDVPVEPSGETPPELVLTEAGIIVTNLRNVRQSSRQLPSLLQGFATVAGNASLETEWRFDIMSEEGEWDLSASCRNVHLPNLNGLADAYANLDFESGDLDLFLEMAIFDMRVDGYVKVLVEDLKVFSLDEENRNPLGFLWEAVSGLFVQIFENQKEDQFAMKIPFEGELDQTDENMLATITSILSNALVEAMKPGVENSVNIEDLKNDE